MLTPREKYISPPLEKFSSEEDRTHDAASSRTVSPTHYQRAIPAPNDNDNDDDDDDDDGNKPMMTDDG